MTHRPSPIPPGGQGNLWITSTSREHPELGTSVAAMCLTQDQVDQSLRDFAHPQYRYGVFDATGLQLPATDQVWNASTILARRRSMRISLAAVVRRIPEIPIQTLSRIELGLITAIPAAVLADLDRVYGLPAALIELCACTPSAHCRVAYPYWSVHTWAEDLALLTKHGLWPAPPKLG